MIRKVPVPTAGVMLGLAALGNLLAPYSMILKYACGISSAFLGVLLFSKIILHPQMMKNDLNGNSIFASVFATFFMAIMQLCTYTFPFAPIASEVVWYGAICGHFMLMAWFTYRYIILFVAVLTQMPKLLKLKFYPSYAAFTFPFVITAIALRQTVSYLNEINIAVPSILNYVVGVETILATAIVTYVFIRYLKFLHEQMIVNMGDRAKTVFGTIINIVK